jgi:hypothetical protein
MPLPPIDSIWFRQVTDNDFLNIERHPSNGPIGGGGALYLEVPSRVAPKLIAMLGQGGTVDVGAKIDARAIGAPGMVAPLEFLPKSGNRLRLFQNRQSGPTIRHPAWRPALGFPQASDNIRTTKQAHKVIGRGLSVFVVKTTSGDFYAGYVTGGFPAKWPIHAGLRSAFAKRADVVNLSGALFLDPGSVGLPFRSSASAPAVRRSPTVSNSMLNRRATALLGTIAAPPAGQKSPAKTGSASTGFKRDPRVAAWVRQEAKGKCESCGKASPFVTEGKPFLEVHHVRPLGEGGSDRVQNAVAVCPNCHRAFHYSDNADKKLQQLYNKVKRLEFE